MVVERRWMLVRAKISSASLSEQLRIHPGGDGLGPGRAGHAQALFPRNQLKNR